MAFSRVISAAVQLGVPAVVAGPVPIEAVVVQAAGLAGIPAALQAVASAALAAAGGSTPAGAGATGTAGPTSATAAADASASASVASAASCGWRGSSTAACPAGPARAADAHARPRGGGIGPHEGERGPAATEITQQRTGNRARRRAMDAGGGGDTRLLAAHPSGWDP